MASSIKLLLVDDHPCIHIGVRAELSARQEICLYAAHSFDEGLRLANEVCPHIVVTDLTLGRSSSGIDLIAGLGKIPGLSPLRALVYTASEANHFWRDASAAGASGYVLKVSDTSRLVEAVDRVLEGKEYLDPAGRAPRVAHSYSFGEYTLISEIRELVISGRPKTIGWMTSRFLCCLLDCRVDRGAVWVGFDHLRRELYATESEDKTENITQLACDARRALEKAPLIETRMGRRRLGVPSAYRISVDVERRTSWLASEW